MQPFEGKIRPKSCVLATHSAAGERDHEKNADWNFDDVFVAIGARSNCEEAA